MAACLLLPLRNMLLSSRSFGAKMPRLSKIVLAFQFGFIIDRVSIFIRDFQLLCIQDILKIAVSRCFPYRRVLCRGTIVIVAFVKSATIQLRLHPYLCIHQFTL